MPTPAQTLEQRFEALFRRHSTAVYRFAARRTDPAAAEDVVAETFTICWRRLRDVPEGRELPWLYRTASNVLLGRARSSHHAADKARRASIGTPGSTPDPIDALVERDALARAFSHLPEADREALRLIAWEELSITEAARVTGTSYAAFAMRVHRARRRLSAAVAAGADPIPIHRRATEESAP